LAPFRLIGEVFAPNPGGTVLSFFLFLPFFFFLAGKPSQFYMDFFAKLRYTAFPFPNARSWRDPPPFFFFLAVHL